MLLLLLPLRWDVPSLAPLRIFLHFRFFYRYILYVVANSWAWAADSNIYNECQFWTSWSYVKSLHGSKHVRSYRIVWIVYQIRQCPHWNGQHVANQIMRQITNFKSKSKSNELQTDKIKFSNQTVWTIEDSWFPCALMPINEMVT